MLGVLRREVLVDERQRGGVVVSGDVTADSDVAANGDVAGHGHAPCACAGGLAMDDPCGRA